MTFRGTEANRVLALMITVFMLMSVAQVNAAQVDNQDTGDILSVPDYIMQCYDGSGFADAPGDVSDLQTTLDAVQILVGEHTWASGERQAIDGTVTRYAAMQSPERGGFVNEGETSPGSLSVIPMSSLNS